ncbi:MAG: type II secretion system protein GspG [Fimbriimonadaceae bacterium]|jgi:general secretion pathway protein G|nr:type II secretion system protein GspG [Fimbriimonadaceae bacterium]
MQVIKGYTLVQTLSAAAIVGMISSIAMVNIGTQGRLARERALVSELSTIRSALQAFRSDTGLYPNAVADLASTTAPSKGRDNAGTEVTLSADLWRGPYLKRVPLDPITGASFSYGNSASFKVFGLEYNVRSSSSLASTGGPAYNTF